MTIHDDIRSEQQPKGERCSVGMFLARSADAAEWVAAMADDAFQSASISRAMAKHGGDVKQPAISRHRRRACNCP